MKKKLLNICGVQILRKGDKVRILHHQPKDFTQEARFSDKEFQVSSFLNTAYCQCFGSGWIRIQIAILELDPYWEFRSVS